MPDRVVSYDFRAKFGQFTAGLAAMGKSVDATAGKLTALDRNGQRMRAGLTQLGNTGGKVGLVFAAGVAVAVGAAANFEQAMSNVQAATHETSENMAALRQAALDAGQATKFSATEAAGAVEELAKAGVSTADILGGGLTGDLDLAAAGGLEVADAASIAATALTQFRLEGEDVPHVADLLAAAAGKAQGDVSDMSMALKQSGLVAAQMGISIEETTGTLAEFASAGLLGSDAGTSFRTMLLRLANPTVESAKLMKQLGIEAYDAQGNFVGIESLAGQLQTAFQGQTQAQRDAALATIFGSDAIRAASVLYQGGAAAVADWTNKVNDQGYAADTAAIKMDNLKGDLEQLRGSLETALIGAGGGAQGPLRSIVQGATDAVNVFNDLPGPVKSTATALGAITAVTGGGLWFGAKVISGVAETKRALQDLGVSANVSAKAMKGLGIAAGVATSLLLVAAAIRSINEARRETLPGVQSLSEDLLELSTSGDVGALSDQFKDLSDDLDRIFNKTADEKIGDTLFTPFKTFLGETHETQEALDEIEALDAALANLATSKGPEAAADALQGLVDSGVLTAEQLGQLQTRLPQLDDALAGLRLSGDGATGSLNSMTGLLFGMPGALDATTGATDGYADATGEAGASAGLAADQIAEMVKAMEDQRSAALDAFDAVTGYRQAMKDAAKQAKESNAGIQGNSDAALKNRDALSGLAAAWNSQDKTVTDSIKKYREARANFIATAEAMGVPKKAARQLAETLLELPEKKVIPTSTPGANAAAGDVEHLANQLDRLHDRTITVRVNRIGGVTSSAGGHSASVPGERILGDPRISGRTLGRSSASVADTLRSGGIETVAGRSDALHDQAEAKAALALSLLAKGSDEAHGATKGLKARLEELEKRLARVSKAADAAHDTLQSLKDQRAGLASSVTGALTHDPFGGSLSDFAAQVGADTADAQAMLAALRAIIQNGVDPRSAFFQQLAASGNVSLAQQFAALTRGDLANFAFSFAQGQAALNDVGQFAGDQAFNQAIKAQTKVVDRLDNTVKHLTNTVNQLEKAVKDMPDKVRQGAKDGVEGRDFQTRTRARTGG